MPRILATIALALLAVSAVSSVAMAQANALDRDHRTSALIELGHPYLQDIADPFVALTESPTASNGVLLLAGRHAFGSSFAAVVDVPISHYGWNETGEFHLVRRDSLGSTDSSVVDHWVNSGTGLGNCYFGIELLSKGSPLIIEAGFRPNFNAKFRPAFVGIATDLALWEAFTPGATFRAGFRTHTDLSRPTSCLVRGALGVVTGNYINSYLLISGGVTGRQRLGHWILAPAVDAHATITGEPGEHLVAQAEMAAERQMAHARPGVFARFYLNSDWHDVVTWTLGLRCNAF